MKTKVYLVGAGPGDPGLITVQGRTCIQKADVIIYDYLASPALLKYARKSAELIYVGKKGGDHTLSQDEINALIVEKAKSGGIICKPKRFSKPVLHLKLYPALLRRLPPQPTPVSR